MPNAHARPQWRRTYHGSRIATARSVSHELTSIEESRNHGMADNGPRQAGKLVKRRHGLGVAATLGTQIGGDQVRLQFAVGGHVRKSLVGCLLLVLCGALAACGGGSTTDPAGAPAAPTTALSHPPASPS